MAFSIKDEETDRYVRHLAKLTGESLTEAVAQAAKERIERLEQVQSSTQRSKKGQLQRFLKNRTALHYQDRRSLKDVTDELWES